MDIFWFVIIYVLNAYREVKDDDDKSFDECEHWPF